MVAFPLIAGATVTESGASAFYPQIDDTITMPDWRAFTDAEGFYATLPHELAHWPAPCPV